MVGRIKQASVISIGNEVLSGHTVDTNAAHIERQLRMIGVPTVSSHTVVDLQPAIVRALKLAAEEADIVIATGGLGPTDDDLTREGFAEFLGVELELREDLLVRISEMFRRRGVPMVRKNANQARLPKGADVVPNEWGTAPGIVAEKEGKVFFALPGVPREMERMLAAWVLPRLRAWASSQAVAVRRLRCFGAGESAIAEMIGEAMRRDRNPLVNCTAHSGVITLEIVATADTVAEAERLAEREEVALREVLGPLVYGTGEETLAEVVGRQLKCLGKTLALAESCTGGLLAKLITDVPGASRYFTRGWVTYSNDAKTDELGVPQELIEKHGAVSGQVAEAMARGARARAGADYAIGITGIAGPDGGTEQKPVGLVFISVDCEGQVQTRRYVFPWERGYVRLHAAQTALDILRRGLAR
ncbi:MAG TPA: competence/damage-inducible protein A [Sedimentisphaerales bacterium]|nr:competence/damage-inducible protein A [Sedimentisphaerales bacterium]HRS09546.1 competence/damage-inducible protein A [Sedimentisphaerales bacterium]HRV46243.1 competence/damage-inducible protein A [Sedimentisphaerales bacterium]